MKKSKKITEFTKDEYEEFFSWLLDRTDINLEKEYDISRCLEIDKPYIYYTPEIKAFFETSAMKRLGKIGQIPNVSLTISNSIQDRLEHCKGAYQKILDFYMLQYKKDNWRERNSDEDSRLKVLADIMDMASHDIGHNIGSHALESFIGLEGKKGAHEILGNRILHEREEVVRAFNNIHPKLLTYLDIVKKQDYNLHTLKEGNIDFDRADFLTRDSLYFGMENGFEENTGDSIPILLDTIINGCETYIIQNNGKEFACPIYGYEVVPEIEEFLKRRLQNYNNIYISRYTRPNDHILEEFCKTFYSSDEEEARELKLYLKHIANNSIENIDLDMFLSWNGIKFYNSLFDIAENSKDSNLRNFAILCLPTVESMKSIVQNKLFPQITPKIDENGNEIEIENEFKNDEDKAFYLKVKDIVQNKDERYYKNRVKNECFGVFFTEEAEKDKFIHSLKKDFKITDEILDSLICWNSKINLYNKKEPIFILGKDKKIYTFDEYPERKLNIDPVYNFGIFGIKSKLLFDGLNIDQVNLIESAFEKANEKYKIDFSYNITDTRLLSEIMDMKYDAEER